MLTLHVKNVKKKKKLFKQVQPLKTPILQGNNLDVLWSLGNGEINSIWTTSETIPIETESSRQKGLVGNLGCGAVNSRRRGRCSSLVLSRALGSRWGRRAAD